jgi:homoserine acetyltransferase
MSIQETTEIKFFDLYNFTFQDGTSLAHVHLAYQESNPHASKVALIPTCFRGRIQSTLNLADGALRDHRIIVVALFGNGQSSSPSNTPGFPSSIDYRDCIRAQYELCTKYLNISSLDVMMGFSMGGQCTYYWTVTYPTFVRNAIIICSSAQTSRHNYQFLEGPKAALENSIDYAIENRTSKPLRGLIAFGKAYSAWLTSAEWFEQELFKNSGYESLQDWDRDVAGANYNGWDPDDLLIMLRMWQNADLRVCSSNGKCSLKEVLAQIQARVLLMPCRTDQYFRWEASEKELCSLKNSKFEIIPSVWGHLAGAGSNQQDTDWMDRTIATFLRTA